MSRSLFITLLSIAAACGGGSALSGSGSTSPIADPIPMRESGAGSTAGVEPVEVAAVPTPPIAPEPPVAPAPPDPAVVRAELLAVELRAYEQARPVFEKFCASCHTAGNKGAKAKTLAHFETTTYPFRGEHAVEVGKEVRRAVGLAERKPTMPKNKPGAVAGDDLATIAAWADAFDAASAGGAHEGRTPAAGHVHDDKPAPRPAQVKPAAPLRFQIVVTSNGFEPKNITVPRNKPVVLRFERKVERTCGTEVVMVVDGKKYEKELPLDTPVELALTFRTAGTVKYSCAMDMVRGTITVN